MVQAPLPNYDYDADELVKLYQNAMNEILLQLNNLNLDKFTRANQLATLKSISEILKELNVDAGEFAQQSIEKAFQDGIINTILSLGIVDNVADAENLVSFNKMNKEFIKALVADTQGKLLAVTNNVDNKVRVTVRKVSGEVLRSNVTKGINGTQTLRRDLLAELKAQLGDSINTGIIDAANRTWRPAKYVNVLVRTVMMEAHKESTINEALGRGVFYAIISKHGAKDACSKWEGKIVKLTREAEGDYPYIGDLPKDEIFHPCCKHVITPVRRPEEDI